MADLSSPKKSVLRRVLGRVRRLVVRAVGLALILGIGAVAADYFLSHDGPPAARRDANDRLASFETGTGEVKRYTYDASGRLTEVSYARRGRFSDLLYPATRTTRARFDAAQRRTALEDDTGRTTFTFDESGLLAGVTDPSGLALRYTRGPWGEIRAIELPDWRQLAYRYDARLRPTRVMDGDVAITYEYRDDQREIVRRLPGVTTLTRHDPRGGVSLIRHTRADGQVILELRYQRDDDGRVIRREETSAAGTRVWQFQYDPLGRLVRVTEPGGSVELAYDADGNLTSRSDAGHVTRFTYEQGQLVRESRYDRSGQDLDLVDEIELEYDRRGQLRLEHGKKRVVNYEWNADGQLVGVRRSDGTVRYTYNGDGLRVARKLHGKRTEYLHHLDGPLPEVIVERDPDGRIAHDILGPGLGLGFGRVGRRGPDGARAFYLEDDLGSTRVVVDDRGQPLARYEYSELGMPRRLEGSAEAPYLFTGQSWDPDTELLFLRNRYYSPSMARFLSPDPHPPTLADPQSLNRYAYCEGDPINRIDPMGLQPWVPPPPPPPYYDSNQEFWRMLSLHRDYLSVQLFQPPAFPPPMYDPVWASYGPPPVGAVTQPPPLSAVPNYSVNQTHSSWEASRKALDVAEYLAGRLPHVPEWVERPIGRVNVALSAFDFAIYARQGQWGYAAVAFNQIWLGAVPVVGPELALAASFIPAEDQIMAARAVVVGGREELRQGNVARFLATPLTLAHIAVARAVTPSELRIDRHDPAFDMLLRAPELGLGSTRQGFFPPGPPGGPGAALPGGVYFDQTAKVLGDLGAITGAVFDKASGRLVLVGDRRQALPPIKPQILAAAIRAVYSPCREAPGMTIDPNPENPRGPVMLVRFFCTDHTELGQVMFESDRLLKGYSVGTDNVTRARVTSSVPGYRSVTERSLDAGARSNELWSRFWIVPEPVTAKISDQGILFDPIRLRVKTETMRFADGKLVPAGGAKDPAAEDFAAHFTEHYAEFAREQPAFAELEAVAQAVALARWLKDSGVPADWGFVASVLAEPYPTPTTTPSAYNQLSRQTGQLIQTVQVVGGVDMQPKLVAARDPHAGEVARQVLAEVSKLPDGPALATVQIDGREHSVAVLSGAAPRLATFDAAERDLALPPWASELADLPGLTRYYSSTDNRPTELGGWSLRLPRLERERDPEAPDNTVRTLSYDGMAPVAVERFALVDGERVVRFIRAFPDQGLKRVGFAPEAGGDGFRGIYPEAEGLYRLYYTSGDQAMFDSEGRLRAVFRGEAAARYRFRGDGRLDAVEYRNGERRIEAVFERDDRGRITAIAAGDRRADYAYSAAGDLAAARGAHALGYHYNEHHRPIEIAVDGKVVRAQKLDGAGRLTELADGDGHRVLQSFTETPHGISTTRVSAGGIELASFDDKLRPTRLMAPGGAMQDFQYERGALQRVTTTLPGGAQTATEYSPAGDPVLVTDPAGTRTAIRYLADRRPAEVSINGASFASFEYGPGGLARIRYRGGYEERFEREANGAITGYARVAPGDDAGDPAVWLRRDRSAGSEGRPGAERSAAQPHVVEDADGRPVRVESADGTASTIRYDAQGEIAGIEMSRGTERRALEARGRELTIRSASGSVTYASDEQHRLISVRDPSGSVTSYAYDPTGKLAEVRLPSGRSIHCGDPVVDWACGR